MNLDSLNKQLPLDKITAKNLLIQVLQNAHAGEKAAANAYWGHANSFFIKSKEEKEEILKIYRDELHHRTRIKEMLSELNANPRFTREVLMYLIGAVIAFLCLFGGWYIPMYGAGKLESTNIEEYEVAARLAYLAELHHLIDELLLFAEIEWDHEVFFEKKIQEHSITKFLGVWLRPGPKEDIRNNYKIFLQPKI
jgi:rubrerythrin